MPVQAFQTEAESCAMGLRTTDQLEEFDSSLQVENSEMLETVMHREKLLKVKFLLINWDNCELITDFIVL